VSDSLTLQDRITINAGMRFDHTRAISQDLHARDLEGRETDQIVTGLGPLYTWNVWSPRLGVTAKLSADGRTMLRASYGRFHQGVLTAELSSIHPGATPTTTTDFDPATGGYTRLRSVLDPRINLRLDPRTRAPRTDEYSIGVDRSYTLSRAYGLQPSSGTTAAGPQISHAMPTFGRDPNDLTNARGRLPNDRPHVFRLMGTVEVPRTGFVIAANLQHFSGKPWAATTQIVLPQGDQRILLEPRGSRRLSSQSLLDVRVSRTILSGGVGRIEVLVDVLNALNDTAEEGLATDNLFSPNFGQPTVFVDPRRAMIGVRLKLGH
jgi:hypothetical protein